MIRNLLAGLAAREFLQRHWQKRPLLARHALPKYRDFISPRSLFRLAQRDDVESRLVLRARDAWHVEHGPFTGRRIARLPARGWTLLVQGVDRVVPEAQCLLQEFDFVPYSRLDDVMVSYAPPGGGVGPHYDSYDVFLLQIAGTRRWQVSAQEDLALVPGAPLRLLRDFRCEHEWHLAPGDMLYLPPRAAHDGIAVDHCLTASIGFRAPDAQELGLRFLEFLQDELALDGTYADPDLVPPRYPARIGDDMLRKVRRMLSRVSWTGDDIERFLGCHLTEPGPLIRFAPPRKPLARRAFTARAARDGIRLDPKTRMLFRGRRIYINGEVCVPDRRAAPLLRRLADRRSLQAPPQAIGAASGMLYQWYRAGYIGIGNVVDSH